MYLYRCEQKSPGGYQYQSQRKRSPSPHNHGERVNVAWRQNATFHRATYSNGEAANTRVGVSEAYTLDAR